MASKTSEPQLAEDWNVQAQEEGFRIEPVNMLACPKEVKLRCEITGAPATIQMVTPYLTLFFGSRHDAEIAWSGILYKIAPLLGPIRSNPPVIGSEEERQRRKYVVCTLKTRGDCVGAPTVSYFTRGPILRILLRF